MYLHVKLSLTLCQLLAVAVELSCCGATSVLLLIVLLGSCSETHVLVLCELVQMNVVVL